MSATGGMVSLLLSYPALTGLASSPLRCRRSDHLCRETSREEGMTVPDPATHGLWTKSFAPSMAHSMTSGGPPIRMATPAIFLAKAIETTRRRFPLKYLSGCLHAARVHAMLA
jgi:hypothetical protein